MDDDVDVRQSVADLLILEGYDARPLPSADAAWSELTVGVRPSLIILDLWIQGMSSGEFLRRLRVSHRSRTPVLVLSGSKLTDDFEQDVQGVLYKPIEATSLVRAVDRLVTHPAPTTSPGSPPRRRPPPRQRSARRRLE